MYDELRHYPSHNGKKTPLSCDTLLYRFAHRGPRLARKQAWHDVTAYSGSFWINQCCCVAGMPGVEEKERSYEHGNGIRRCLSLAATKLSIHYGRCGGGAATRETYNLSEKCHWQRVDVPWTFSAKSDFSRSIVDRRVGTVGYLALASERFVGRAKGGNVSASQRESSISEASSAWRPASLRMRSDQICQHRRSR